MAAGLEYTGDATAFHGYEHLVCEHSKVAAIYIDGTLVARAQAGDDVVIVLDHTPFYAESGGQVGDTGELRNARSRVIVEDTIKVQASVHGHSTQLHWSVDPTQVLEALEAGQLPPPLPPVHSVMHIQAA